MQIMNKPQNYKEAYMMYFYLLFVVMNLVSPSGKVTSDFNLLGWLLSSLSIKHGKFLT